MHVDIIRLSREIFYYAFPKKFTHSMTSPCMFKCEKTIQHLNINFFVKYFITINSHVLKIILFILYDSD
jgi:hypothetical protein